MILNNLFELLPDVSHIRVSDKVLVPKPCFGGRSYARGTGLIVRGALPRMSHLKGGLQPQGAMKFVKIMILSSSHSPAGKQNHAIMQ